MADRTIVDRFLKKRLDLRWGRTRVTLDVPVDVFSSYQFDVGTSQLIRVMSKVGRSWKRSLDIGCGYGPIPVWLAATGLSDRVEGIERDWIAATYAARNASAMGLENIRIRGGLAFEGAEPASYDLIVSNLPAKAGSSVHRSMLLGASEYLADDGQVWIVVVKPLTPDVDAILATKGVEIFERTTTSSHAVYGYTCSARLPTDPDPYVRGIFHFAHGGVSYTMESLHNLPEFDTLSFSTKLLANTLIDVIGQRPHANLAIVNPTQGHLGVLATSRSSSIERVILLSRDALALRASKKNLLRSGFAGDIEVCHGVELPDGHVDVVVGRLAEKEGVELALGRVDQMLRLDSSPRLILASKSAFHGRLRKRLAREAVHLGKSLKREGYSVSVVQARV